MEKAEPLRSAQTRALTHTQSVAICEGKHMCYIYKLSRSCFSVCLMWFIVWKKQTKKQGDPNNLRMFFLKFSAAEVKGQVGSRFKVSQAGGGSVKPDFLVEWVQQRWPAAICKVQTLRKCVCVCVYTLFHVFMCDNLLQMSKNQFIAHRRANGHLFFTLLQIFRSFLVFISTYLVPSTFT